MRKVLLIQPPLNPESMNFGIMDPYALEILASGLRENNRDIHVKIIDLRVEKRTGGLKELVDFNPDIVGITGITIDYPGMADLLRFVKKNCGKDTLTVVGGHHATMVPGDFYLSSCDIIVRGPGIEALKEISCIETSRDLQKIKGIIYRDENNDFHETPASNDFDEIKRWPLPAYDLTQKYMNKYLSFGHRYNVVTTALGCPFRCSFCACWKAFSGRYVTGTPEAVVRQIANTPKKYIFFGDDFTFGNIKQAAALAKQIKEAGIKKYYSAYCRADVIAGNPGLMEMWRDIGLQSLTVGMESFDEADLELYNKKTTLAANHKANEILLKLGIHNVAHLIIKPSYSEEDFRRMSDYALELGVAHPVFPILTPLPGTDLAEECRDRLITKEHQYYDLAHPVMDIGKEDIESYYDHVRMLYLRSYSYKRWIIGKARKFINFITGRRVYTEAQVNVPEFISLPYMRTWVKLQLRKRKRFISGVS
jgi:radical SAM superfamily enzyme YgiQ (UPF0313 family)